MTSFCCTTEVLFKKAVKLTEQSLLVSGYHIGLNILSKNKCFDPQYSVDNFLNNICKNI